MYIFLERSFRRMRFSRKAALSIGVIVGLVFGLFTVPAVALAAPNGAFTSVAITKVADGYSLTNNPVDSSGDNGIVAVRDYVGFRIQGNTSEAVSDATMTLTKPSCWVWETTVDQNLNFNLDNGQTTGSVAHPDADTIVVTWTQAPSGTVLTQPFRAKAGESCADGSTWTPEFSYTDASGTHTQTLDTLTVRSVASADISIQTVGQPSLEPNRWFGGGATEWGGTGGAGPALVQRWDVSLRPDAIAKTGYADPAGDITFTVAYSGPRSAFELPRAGSGTPNVQGAGCWVYVSPSATNNGQFYPSSGAQTVTITMKKSAACEAMLADNGNKLVIYSFTPQKVLEDNYGCSANLGATVAPTAGWQDQQGRTIADSNPSNNTAAVPLSCQTVVYDSNWGSAYFTPKDEGANLAAAYPENSTGHPIVAAAAQNEWAMLSTNATNGAGFIGVGGTFTSEAGLSPSAPKLTDLTSFHLWDPSVQQIDLANLDAAVLGAMRPASSAPASLVLDPSTYDRSCTTGYDGTNAASVGSMVWADCASLDPTQISGIRFFRAGVFNGENFNVNFPASKLMFSQVPMRVVGDVGDRLPTRTIWQAAELAQTTNYDVSATIIGNVLRIGKSAQESQVIPEGEIHYTLKPAVATPAGTFSPGDVENLVVVDKLDIGVQSVDLSNVDPFWDVTQQPADFGSDGVPYTSDDVRGIVLTFTPSGQVQSSDTLPQIDYTAKMGILLPPQAAPYSATVKNTATVAADGMDPEVAAGITPKRHSASASVLAGTPEAAFFSKQLISEPVIEVDDLPVAWRVQWVNYNNYDLGQGTFVDVFPYDDDARGSDFHGSLNLSALGRIGSALQPGTQVQLTSAAPSTIGSAPANDVTWVTVDPDNASTWPQNPTGVRVIVPNVEASTQGYGAIDLRFEADGQRGSDIYHNDSSGLVHDPVQNRTIDLGVRDADPVRVIASSIAGVVWVDKNADGIRQQDEALLPNSKVYLYRDGDTSTPLRTATTDANGAYRFTQLHSSDYQVVFDVAQLKSMGYRLTDQGVGSDITVDSDADIDSGEVDELALPRDTDVEHLDAGLIAIGLQAGIDANASLTRSYAWNIEKRAANESTISIDPSSGEAEIDYEIVTTEGAATDSDAQLTGEVTVANPLEDKSYTFTATVSADGSGLVCTVQNGQGRTIAPQQTLVLQFGCVGAPGNDLDRRLTATVAATDLDPVTGQPVEPATAAADIDYQVTEVNRTIDVTDSMVIAGTSQPVRDLGPYTWSAEGTAHTEQYNTPVTVPAGECLAVQNTAKIEQTGQNDAVALQLCHPLDLVVSKNVLTSMERSYGWGISKRLTNPDVQLDSNGEATLDYEVVVTERSATDASWTMNGAVTVTNPNAYKSVAATVEDTADIGGGVVCTFAGGDSITLGANETRVLPYTCSFASEPAYTGVNTARVTWTSDLAGADQSLVEQRTVTGTADILEADWNLTEFLKTVNVSDVVNIGGQQGGTREFGPYTWSAEGTEHAEQYSVDIRVAAGQCLAVDNAAAIIETGGRAATQHLLCNEAPLGIADVATASLLRVYGWSIDKQLTNREQIASDSTPVSVGADYSVVVTEGDVSEGTYELTGRLTLTNPNSFRSFVVNLEDSIDIAGLSCVLDRSTNVVVPAKGSAVVNYRCDGDPNGTLSGTHTVHVTGDDFTALDHSQTVEYQPRDVNRTITVSDDRYTFDPAWRISWTSSGTEHRRDYSLTVATKPGTCHTFANTARIGADGPSSSASFEVCAPSSARGSGWLSLTGSDQGVAWWLAALLLVAGAAGLGVRSRRRRA